MQETTLDPSAAAHSIRTARHAGAVLDAEWIATSLLSQGKANIDVLLEAAQYYAVRNDLSRAQELSGRALEIASNEVEATRVCTLRTHYFLKARQFAEARAAVQGLIDRYGLVIINETLRESLGLIDLKAQQASHANPWAAYWAQRRNFVYLHVCKQLMRIVGHSARAVADIGSNRTPTLDFFAHGVAKYSVDPMTPYEGEGVIAVREDFLKWTPPEPIHICTCFQVMEHVPAPAAFAKAMLERCEVSLISVPYLEPPGANPGHIHSMIDLGRLTSWFGRDPNYTYIATELSGEQRIIALYDRTTTRAFAGLHAESAEALRYRFRWSLDGSGVRLAAD